MIDSTNMDTMDRLGPYLLGPNDTSENGIYTGDARELARDIPDESIDLVFTDPVYDRIDDYRWLSETSARVLKMDRACLVWSGKPLAARCQMIMEEAGLRYVYTLDYVVTAKSYIACHLFCWTTPCLWMHKGRGGPRVYMPDTYIEHFGSYIKAHRWNKNPGVITRWLDAFCEPDVIVLDPFTGGGTVPAVCKMLGRRWLAFEIDPDTAELARERVRSTQPPLPGLITLQQRQFEL